MSLELTLNAQNQTRDLLFYDALTNRHILITLRYAEEGRASVYIQFPDNLSYAYKSSLLNDEARRMLTASTQGKWQGDTVVPIQQLRNTPGLGMFEWIGRFVSITRSERPVVNGIVRAVLGNPFDHDNVPCRVLVERTDHDWMVCSFLQLTEAIPVTDDDLHLWDECGPHTKHSKIEEMYSWVAQLR